MEITIWCAAILLMVIGLIGSVVPLLPGTTLILAGVLLQKWLIPASLTWFAVGWVVAFWLFSVLADIGCTVLGTRLFGGGKWGMAGATGGALAGMFFSLPALLLGTIFGAVAAEKWFGKRTNEQALRAGAGAAFGFLLGTVTRLACALAMIGVYLVSVYYALPAKPVAN